MDLEKKTNNADKPMENWTRVIIETDEKNPKTIAVVVNDDYEVADGFRVRLKPSTLPWSQSLSFGGIGSLPYEFLRLI